jgi:hypothetical protein
LDRRKLRIGVLGLSHDHVWDNLRQLVELGGAEVVAAADARPEQVGHMTSYVPMFYGNEGTLVVGPDGLVLATREHEDGISLEVPEPEARLSSSAALFTEHVRSREPIESLCSADVGVATQHVLEAGLLSSRLGCTVELPLPIYQRSFKRVQKP